MKGTYTILLSRGDDLRPDDWFAAVSDNDGIVAVFSDASVERVMAKVTARIEREQRMVVAA